MTGRVIIVTGANSGIGFEVARYLCEGGNDVILACRDEQKGADAVQRIKRLHPNSLVQCMQVDLSSTSSVREFVKDFTKRKRKLNVLVNNAGMCPGFKDLTRKTTTEGFEYTMAVNHFGPFLLTNLLLEYMIQTANIMGEARIVNVTCGLHDHENNWTSRGLDFMESDNFQLQKEGTYKGLQAYKNSKLCNVLFTYQLADKLSQERVLVNAVDPGIVPTTQLMRHSSKLKRTFTTCCVHKVLSPITHHTKSVRQAAAMVCDVATSEKFEGRSGKFFRDGVEDRSSVESYDIDLQKAIWKKSSRLMNMRSFSGDNYDDISLS